MSPRERAKRIVERLAECWDSEISELPPDTRAKLEEIIARDLVDVDPRQPVPELAGTFPIVLYFPTREDADGFLQIAKVALPNMEARDL